ncbi:type II secretion system protein E [Bacteriovorax sp. BSW11_IV]|uniref:type II secretion system ATPase GspE n=1 Tax=Bacteriovorax sp. BSW11_IV TaxID=1353529 RepID=UPI00038A2217|nr:type II secretion system ATPase GspE [Bacteriovorax sp. BSW11_IV]EQC47801.1 type II secretion system protein E [Bacteriovorax sp. BSW11_IV]
MKIHENILEKVEFHKEKIGQLLLKHTSLTEDQLHEALELQEETGMMVGEILLKKNYIHPHDIIKVICHQVEIPYVTDIKIDDINPEITNKIPINYAKQNEIIPILETNTSVSVVMTDPFKFDAINDLREIFKKEIKIIVSSPLKVNDAINRVYEKANKNLVASLEDEFEENFDLDGPIDILDAGADEAPVIRFVNSIIFRAVKERATDIHIEPYEKESVYRFRINRVMTEILRQPLKTQSAVASRIKVMAKLDIAEKRLPQDGRIPIKMAGKDIDIRLSTVPVQHGERIVMRILEKDNKILNLESLGFHGKILNDLKELTQRKHGVVYVSGPTGHGKTTTLFAMLERINQPDRMIITVEDPVEYEIHGISQIQVNSKIDLSFARALRSILRQNPDVIMVGETRDLETAEMAVQASLTGHFVLSTIHTNDAASAPGRLIDMGVQPFLIASSLAAVLAQRLIRTLCSHCKEPHSPTDIDKELLRVNNIPPDATIFNAKGCPKCDYKGYEGMTVVSELLMIDDHIRSLVLKKADAGSIKKLAVKHGMTTLRQDALVKVFSGITSIDEIVRAINAEETTED